MVSNAGGHRWRLPHALGCGETRMQRAEVITRADQLHPLRQRLRQPRQCARSSYQWRQPCAECRVQALDKRGIEHLAAWRTPQAAQEVTYRAVSQAVAQPLPVASLFDHLRDHQLWPWYAG